jgi:hypothetical protein
LCGRRGSATFEDVCIPCPIEESIVGGGQERVEFDDQHLVEFLSHHCKIHHIFGEPAEGGRIRKQKGSSDREREITASAKAAKAAKAEMPIWGDVLFFDARVQVFDKERLNGVKQVLLHSDEPGEVHHVIVLSESGQFAVAHKRSKLHVNGDRHPLPHHKVLFETGLVLQRNLHICRCENRRK